MNLMSKTPKIELLLKPQEMLSLDNGKQPVAVACKNGMVWVTVEGELTDHILPAGERYTPKTRGSIVIQALDEEACVDIEEKR